MKKLALIVTVVMLLASFVHAQEKVKEVMIIINTNSPIGVSISAGELKDIYLGKVRFKGEIKILAANYKDVELFEIFLKSFIGMSSTAYKTYWVKKAFAEGGEAPKPLGSASEMLKFVSENRGAIGYLSKDDITVEVKGVKIVSVREK